MHFYNFSHLFYRSILILWMPLMYSMEKASSNYNLTIHPELLHTELYYHNNLITTSSASSNFNLIKKSFNIAAQAIVHTMQINKDKHFIISVIKENYSAKPNWASIAWEKLSIFNLEDNSVREVSFNNGKYHNGLGTALYLEKLELVAVHPSKPLLLCKENCTFRTTVKIPDNIDSFKKKEKSSLALLEIMEQPNGTYTLDYPHHALINTEPFALPTVVNTSYNTLVQK